MFCFSIAGRARKNLKSFVPVPSEIPKTDDEKKSELGDDKKLVCDKCKEDKCDDCSNVDIDPKQDKDDDSKKNLGGRKVRRPRKNRKAVNKQDHGQCFFPMSMAMLYGPLAAPAPESTPLTFPYNVTFKQVRVLCTRSSICNPHDVKWFLLNMFPTSNR